MGTKGCTAADVGALALSLPETTEEPHHDMTSFRVGGKIFATVPADADRVHIFIGSDDVAAYCAEYPGQVEELWWGKRLRGCRMPLETATRPLLHELLTEAWRRRAPTTLLAQFDG
jgi:hypothetical protein